MKFSIQIMNMYTNVLKSEAVLLMMWEIQAIIFSQSSVELLSRIINQAVNYSLNIIMNVMIHLNRSNPFVSTGTNTPSDGTITQIKKFPQTRAQDFHFHSRSSCIFQHVKRPPCLVLIRKSQIAGKECTLLTIFFFTCNKHDIKLKYRDFNL